MIRREKVSASRSMKMAPSLFALSVCLPENMAARALDSILVKSDLATVTVFSPPILIEIWSDGAALMSANLLFSNSNSSICSFNYVSFASTAFLMS